MSLHPDTDEQGSLRKISPGEKAQSLMTIAHECRTTDPEKSRAILTEVSLAYRLVDMEYDDSLLAGATAEELKAIEIPDADRILSELYARHCSIGSTTSPQLPSANIPQLP